MRSDFSSNSIHGRRRDTNRVHPINYQILGTKTVYVYKYKHVYVVITFSKLGIDRLLIRCQSCLSAKQGKYPATLYGYSDGVLRVQLRRFSVQKFSSPLLRILSHIYCIIYGNGQNRVCLGVSWTKSGTGVFTCRRFGEGFC